MYSLYAARNSKIQYITIYALLLFRQPDKLRVVWIRRSRRHSTKVIKGETNERLYKAVKGAGCASGT